ncbi:hypothetical protein Nepgr_014112 [Nepenthes gracilis]|uniref:Rhomboid-like protein n=1 Tax=Nepenthes gracilis TaxID=150966 RepID=A0AAD3XPZ9_NEPGR|nr:hypothetical protein Nepgr_014112 [Nepenthes gracilis]
MHRRTLSSEKEFTLFNPWFPWLVPSFVVANVALFVITMYVDNCPKNSLSCFAGFSVRLFFQPVKENPLHGPSSTTTDWFVIHHLWRRALRTHYKLDNICQEVGSIVDSCADHHFKFGCGNPSVR